MKHSSLFTILVAITFSMGCGYSIVNLKDYTPITNTIYELTALGMIEKGNCIPLELKTVVIPAMTKINETLKGDKVKIADVLELLKSLDVNISKDVLLYSIMAIGITNMMKDLTNIGNINLELSGKNLELVKSLIEINLDGMKAAASVADMFNGWCKE